MNSPIPLTVALLLFLFGTIAMGVSLNASHRFNDMVGGKCQCSSSEAHLEGKISAMKTMEVAGIIWAFSWLIAFLLAFIFCPMFRLVFCMSAATMGTLWVAKQTYKKLRD